MTPSIVWKCGRKKGPVEDFKGGAGTRFD